MPYFPTPYDGVQQLEGFLQNELQLISEALSPLSDGAMDVRHVVPERPRNGLFYADGVDWDPGDGRGIYRFDEDSDTFIEVGAAPVAPPAEINDLTVAVVWDDVPDANITAGSVTQHATALEAVLNHDNLQDFLTSEHFTEASISLAESQIIDGSILARLADDENVAGQYTFSNVNIPISLTGVATGNVIIDFPGTGVSRLKKITNQGGWSWGSDSSFVLHAGDTVDAFVTGLGITAGSTGEKAYIGADTAVEFFSNLQSNYASAFRAGLFNNGQFRVYFSDKIDHILFNHDGIDGHIAVSTGILKIDNDMDMLSVVGDKLTLYGTHDNPGSYAIGIESNTLYFKSPSTYRWYRNVNADGGVSDQMELNDTGLYLFKQGQLRCYAENNSDYYRVWHDGTDVNMDSNATANWNINADGDAEVILFHKTSTSNDVVGQEFSDTGHMVLTRNSAGNAVINRLGTDGQMIGWEGQGTQEGNINLTGTTIQYNGAHLGFLTHEKGNARDVRNPLFIRGTVMEYDDEKACWWSEVFWDWDQRYPIEKRAQKHWTRFTNKMSHSTNQAHPPGHDSVVTECENEQRMTSKISDTVGTKKVAGVFDSWMEPTDDEHSTATTDFTVATTGDYVIRVTGPCDQGDLLESNGDGTAVVQADDLIRSSTIAKAVQAFSGIAVGVENPDLVPCQLLNG